MSPSPYLWSLLVVFTTLYLDLGAGMQQPREPVLVEACVAQPTIERFDIIARIQLMDVSQVAAISAAACS